ncbi:MAG TPA: ubiquinol-cytochrome c reductase iron-sulfur subunit [Caulobacteraceae bacterium]|nr:ubiquinol-cytochrome c reductase iron-sulfur subunit [Caulobacteraceae bacterium]
MSDTVAATSSPGGGAHDDPNRRDFIHIAAAAAAVGGVAAVAWPLIDEMNPSGDVLALSSIEFDLTKVLLGQQVVVKWRSQPVFVRHRTPKEIAEAVADDGKPMRDPATDASRHKPGKSEWLILIGVCTHLGCIPNFGQGPYGGWLCPCHGSVYDTAGRIRAGPAPLNLYLPDYTFLSDTKVKIG